MSDKKTSAPKEIPLHEVVLQIMFEANKERPAELTVSDVHRKITDDTISESNISAVLKWLVVQKQVECASGKFYSLDRFELIDQRAKDAAKTGEKLNLVTEDNPLHEVILSAMFESSKGEPVKSTLDDIFWMISDPKVQKGFVGDALKWLVNQGRLEYQAGKYSLDRIELQDQEKASAKLAKEKEKKKVSKKPKPKKKVEEKEAKVTLPSSTEEAKPKPKKVTPKKTEPKKVEPEKVEPEKIAPKETIKKKTEPKKVKPEKTAPKEITPKETIPKAPPVKAAPPVVKKVEEVKEQKPVEPVVETATIEEVPAKSKWRIPLLVASIICVIYTFYLLFALNQSVSTAESGNSSERNQQDLVSVRAKLSEISEKTVLSKDDVLFVKQTIEEQAEKTRKIDQKEDSNDRISSLIIRLILSFCLTIVFVTFFLFSTGNVGLSKKS